MSLVPVEFIGKARALRSRIVAADPIAERAMTRASVLVMSQAARGHLTPTAVRMAVGIWDKQGPAIGRLAFSCEHAPRRLRVAETRVSGTVHLRYQKTSPTNALLMAMYNFQRIVSQTWGQNTITVSNPATGDIFTCRKAAFKRRPNFTYAKEGGMVEWVFDVGIIDAILGAPQP